MRHRRPLPRVLHRAAVGAAACLAAATLVPCAADAQTVRSAAGASAADIAPAVTTFRTDLGGGTTAGANGSFGGVRREINWDGVPDAFSAPNNLPANFFNANSPRGVVFSGPGTGFQVSANAGVAPVEFGTIDPSYPGSFAVFSPQRLFTAIGSNVTDVTFFLPGTSTPAPTNGFGVVFTDVDLPNTTSLQFFDVAGNPLGTFFVPALSGNETLSFLGVTFADAVIGRVRITSGNAALGAGVADGGTVDVVAMDDFIYGEPKITPIPEPATVALLATGLGGMAGGAGLRRRGRRSTR